MSETFGGAEKQGKWIFARIEKRFVQHWTPRIPQWIETYHLTLLTLLWSAGALTFGFLARADIRWLWLVSLMIVLQYLSDVFDGAVGRARATGLIKWGFYMDHFLDFLFLASIGIVYALLMPDAVMELFILWIIFGAFMAHGFLAFAATNEFRISFFGIGPTEGRIVLVLVNAAVIAFGTHWLQALLPFVAGAAALALAVSVYAAHRRIWRFDMELKEKSKVR